MYIVTTKYTRPSADVRFYVDSDPAVKEFFQQFLIEHAELVKMENDTTDPLVYVSRAIYKDKTSCELVVDGLQTGAPTFFANRDAYCAANGITIERTVTEE